MAQMSMKRVSRFVLLMAMVLASFLSSRLSAQTFTPIFNGVNLQGWHPIGFGTWTASNGEIVGRHPNAADGFGHLVTDSSYTDFVVRFQFLFVMGNSGFYFRIAEGGWAGVIGMQAEIDPGAGTTGGIYEVSAVTAQDRQWVFYTTKSRDSAIYVPGAWNDMTVDARGGNILITLNGHTMTNLVGDTLGRRQGKFALQIHGGLVGEIHFRNLAVANLSTGIVFPGRNGKISKRSHAGATRKLMGVRIPQWVRNTQPVFIIRH